MHRRLILLVTAAGLGGCASAGTTSQAPSASARPAVTRSSTTERHTSPPRRQAGTPADRARAVRARTGLPVFSASAAVVQPQPAPDSCHASGGGVYSRPDPRCTPGALNPAVAQATIGQTICVPGYTRMIRPQESITGPEKRLSMAAYGDGGSTSSYEYDHLVPLELGGAANDPRNLWPEPGASPNPKDAVEDSLHSLVCAGRMSLAHAQQIIASGWIAYARSRATASAPASPGAVAAAGSAPATPAPAGPGAGCRASASYSARYRDWNVYVHSGQPETTVTVTDAAGRSKSWHTNATGYADIYFKAPASAAGETITVRVGATTCQATL